MKRLSWLLVIPLFLACGDAEDSSLVSGPNVTAPVLLAAKTMDIDGDGTVETIQMLFESQMADETLNTADFAFNPVVGQVFFAFDTNGDKSHNAVMHLSIPDGFYGPDTQFILLYTQGTLADTDGNLLGDTGIVVQKAADLP
jgi:hypothetical protein